MKRVLISGFGGQGIQFAGKFLANAAMIMGMEVTYFPSYGPETRGGASFCHIIISDAAIGSPVVVVPDILFCLSLPALEKFEGALAPGGVVYVDDSLINRKVCGIPDNSAAVYIPATRLAFEHGLEGLGNMIMVGASICRDAICDKKIVGEAMGRVISARKRDMYEANIKAIEIGFGFIK